MTNDLSYSLLHSYKASLSSFDEVFDANGQVKPYWKTLFATLENIGLDGLALRNREIIEKLKENGVTYNVYNSDSEDTRAWKLDPIPFLIHENEWKEIQEGIKQRAELLDLIYWDIYGPQTLIKNRVIPPELVFDNAGFLLPCFDLKQKLPQQLLMYACDMARGPDGKMWLLDNRTQSPSGSGYTLENRTVISQIIPELNKNIYRSRLSPYFSHLQGMVDKLGTVANESPNVVFLTPGPGNETYFEHVYLASYLGYTLVQGNDLLVRNGYVYLKSIEGLVRVDVIIRRVDDEWCDPLELKKESLLGVPGLLQVVRLGHVAVVNNPGACMLENYGFLAFMNPISKHFFGKPLLLNSVATWWCGQPKELATVLQNLDRLIIKKANRKQGFKSRYGRLLSASEKADLQKMIQANPKDFVAQEEVSLSTTPSFIDGKIQPRYAAIRAFLVGDGQNYQVMQGGLTRSSGQKDKFVISNQLGGISKDTWIVNDRPAEFHERIVLKKNVNTHPNHLLTSRNAENLFWVGRLYERTLSTTTFLKIILERLNSNDKGQKQRAYLVVLLKSLTHLTLSYPGFTDEENEELFEKPEPELLALIKNGNKPGSLAFAIKALLQTVNQVSEKWDTNTRRIFNLLDESHHSLQEIKGFGQIHFRLDKLLTRLLSFYGNMVETLPRDTGFYLLAAGKDIERILALISTLRSAFSFKNNEEVENELLETVLENHHLLAHYRHIYKSHTSLIAALDMVFLDKNVPYSFSYLLDNLAQNLGKLPKGNDFNRLSAEEKMVLEASTLIKLVDTDALVLADSENQYREQLDKTLAGVYSLISQVTGVLTSQYFNHSSILQTQSESIEKLTQDEDV